MTQEKLLLDHVYANAERFANEIFLTQPLGHGRVADYTWAQVLDEALRMAAHLRGLGLEPGARIGLLSKNCAHFVIAELAIWIGGYTTVAIFPTETAETVHYVLDHSGASLLFVGKLDFWERQAPGVPAGLPRIALPLAPAGSGEPWNEIVARTQPLQGRPGRKPDDLAMLLYTSGSTGTPKGVMTSFRAISRVAEGVQADLRNRIPRHEPARALSYLPLAHSFERTWIEACSLMDGRTRIYFAESLNTFIEDLQRARPTHFISVPRLWLKFQQGVYAKLPPRMLDVLLSLPLVGRLVARKVLKGLGLDCVYVAASGSAPIPPELISWYRRIGLNLFEGYGMSEDNSFSHASNEGAHAPGYVGVPLPGVEVKLADDGEILVRSPGQCSGYWKQPELTAQSFTEDGFFRTGDLGEHDGRGLLKVTGRVKELFKTSKGEYISPAPIENELNADPMVELSVVTGSGQAQPYAMVMLAEDLRARQKDPAVRAEVNRELSELLHRVNAALPAHARLGRIVVVEEPWSIENGRLTPTMKVRRARIEADAAQHRAEWDRGADSVVWA
ncbi:MAG TPA: AMP-binding protein [Ramlibacter sp.]|uniref:AMP-binding protein n=1 Tax=Ramlibacter sp. TaxID=1917967 RepID=UPI002B597131|nr:AMP-binding protein [Ramlibacter sp.]HVZ44766.1 AMP-binding protein [Ramlibacter sp.]